MLVLLISSSVPNDILVSGDSPYSCASIVTRANIRINNNHFVVARVKSNGGVITICAG